MSTTTHTELSQLKDVAAELSTRARRSLILIDGLGGSGKTTLARELSCRLGANLVHADDVSWHADIVDWDEEMLIGIITPWLRRQPVSYRPSGWIAKGRVGSIDVDPCRPLIVEGVGTCRASLRAVATATIWVETDPAVARQRLIERDLAAGLNGGTVESVTKFADWCDEEIRPLLERERPWDTADFIVSGEAA